MFLMQQIKIGFQEISFLFREKRPKLRFLLKGRMSGEGGEEMGRQVTGERHKLVHYQQGRIRISTQEDEVQDSGSS